MSRLTGRLEAVASGRDDLVAILDRETDALLLEAAPEQAAFANKSMRALLSLKEGDEISPSALESLSEKLADAVVALAVETGVASRIVTVDESATYEVSVSRVADGRRLWRAHRLGGDGGEGHLWRDRVAAHGEKSAAGLYTLNSGGHFLYVNPAMAAWIGQGVEEIVGQGLRIADILVKEGSDDPMRPGIGDISINGAGGRIHDLQVSNALENGPDGARVYG
ncbi:MAG: hypothetical protein KAT39_12305, partial [Alphaproteobacteria bacterium]|nr:hypothetical protein [Alphaproteobacteria bacterium]